MSSQLNKGIPFSHGPDGVHYRLLELPPELASLLEGENPPSLILKSSPAAALLVAAGKTYSLRQKNTSNALIILQPSEEADGNSPSLSATYSEVGMRAIASMHETVELLPETSSAPATAQAKGKWHEKFGRNR